MIGFIVKAAFAVPFAVLAAVIAKDYAEKQSPVNEMLGQLKAKQAESDFKRQQQVKTWAEVEKEARPYLVAVLSVALAARLKDPVRDIYCEVQNQHRKSRETEIQHDENLCWLYFWMLCALLCAILVAVALGLRRRHTCHQERMEESKTQEDVKDKQAERFVKLMQAVQMPDTPDRFRFQHMVFQTVMSSSSSVQPRPCLPRSDRISSPCHVADEERQSISEWSQVSQV